MKNLSEVEGLTAACLKVGQTAKGEDVYKDPSGQFFILDKAFTTPSKLMRYSVRKEDVVFTRAAEGSVFQYEERSVCQYCEGVGPCQFCARGKAYKTK